ncbi:hypothetical protein AXX17_AT3G02180 [Arabidopsis thaliana]|uniref:Transmembrane protein n=1 Tax=Arabidopsis thaliana TaxID=3702 RepID=A0A178VKA5_ARATH|nr:hypothetical protein AXX17_AT3G02180 [Arabidopsis thaliana]
MANCIRRNALFFLTLLFLLSVSNLVQAARGGGKLKPQRTDSKLLLFHMIILIY